MAFNLGALLGLQQSTSELDPTNMIVQGSLPVEEEPLPPRRPTPESLFDPENPTNRNLRNDMELLNRNIAAQEGQAVQKDTPLPGRKGIFGTTGTLRDVLGYLGDAFLMQSGNDPVYGPRVKQERLSDAMAGYADDPLAAIERVMGVDAAAGAELMELFNQNQYRTAQSRADAMRAGTGAIKEERLSREAAMNYVSQATAAALATNDPAALQEAERLAALVSKQYNIPLEELGVTPGMGELEASVLAGRGATVNQNLRLPQQERAVEVQEGNLAERRRANRARERQQSANEAGRERRSIRTDTRVRELDDGRGRDGSRRQLRGTEDTPGPIIRPVRR